MTARVSEVRAGGQGKGVKGMGLGGRGLRKRGGGEGAPVRSLLWK